MLLGIIQLNALESAKTGNSNFVHQYICHESHVKLSQTNLWFFRHSEN